MDTANLFRKIALLKNERLLIDCHIIKGKITDIYKTGEIIYILEPDSVFHTSGMEQHGTLFFDAMGESCFVFGKIFFQPPEKIVLIPKGPTGINKRGETRIETPALPAEISAHHGLMNFKTRGTILNLSLKGAAVLTPKELKGSVVYLLKTFFPFHDQSLRFTCPFVKQHCTGKQNMFLAGISFIDMEEPSGNNLVKYLKRKNA
ncbi:MAG: PilZ domain-containing protein [Candidatus Omnitrophica bacterium]|nr:PilZ domain-containing protein [Candidatus Omnitrophota bacterium]